MRFIDWLKYELKALSFNPVHKAGMALLQQLLNAKAFAEPCVVHLTIDVRMPNRGDERRKYHIIVLEEKHEVVPQQTH